MAVTAVVVEKSATHDGYISYVDITGPASYTTGGEALTAGQVNQILPMLGGGLAVADLPRVLQFVQSEVGVGGHAAMIDRANGKVLFFIGPQVTSTTNLGAVTCRVRLKYGKSSLG